MADCGDWKKASARRAVRVAAMGVGVYSSGPATNWLMARGSRIAICHHRVPPAAR
jgi:hypothetical protein